MMEGVVCVVSPMNTGPAHVLLDPLQRLTQSKPTQRTPGNHHEGLQPLNVNAEFTAR